MNGCGYGHYGHSFTTYDQDNDNYYLNCAVKFKGAWWYNNCLCSNLNGLYLRGNHTSYGDGIEWLPWFDSFHYSLNFTEMKIRPM